MVVVSNENLSESLSYYLKSEANVFYSNKYNSFIMSYDEFCDQQKKVNDEYVAGDDDETLGDSNSLDFLKWAEKTYDDYIDDKYEGWSNFVEEVASEIMEEGIESIGLNKDDDWADTIETVMQNKISFKRNDINPDY